MSRKFSKCPNAVESVPSESAVQIRTKAEALVAAGVHGATFIYAM